jgi:hypothetical protein
MTTIELTNAGSTLWLGAPSTYPTALPQKLHTFPWLAFNNRPYSSAGELLLVPGVSQSRLLARFEYAQSGNPYDNNVALPVNQDLPVGYLPNMFRGKVTKTSTPTDSPGHLFRIFDYLETPSPYVDSNKFLNPTAFGRSLASGLQNSVEDLLRPPFNRISNFRDPGRININTMFDVDTGGDNAILEAVFKQYPYLDTAAFREMVLLSRRGYDSGTGTQMYQFDSNQPSLFKNPFRSADLADMMPLPSMRQDNPVQATFLRSGLTSFSAETRPLFSDGSTDAHNASDRNPYFRYAPLQKVSNVFTTNSNCYAIWITVGYFEAEWNTAGPTNVYPDGYRLGAEMGADSGEIKRHRAFYIVDRSIPVGFEPGEDHNVDKCVLLRRIIE